MEEETNILIPEKEKEYIKKAVEDPISSMRKLLKGNFYFFIQYFWQDYTTGDFIPNWHIEKIAKELEKVAYRVAGQKPKEYDLVFNVPPGTTKTATISIFFPVWCWVNWYWMRFITASHSSPLSLESAEYSRDIVRSERFRELFPDIDIKQDKDNKSNFRVVKKVWKTKKTKAPRILYGGGRISSSVKSKIMGFHGDILIWDDLIDPRAAISDVERKTANDFLDHTLSQRKTNRTVSTTIGIMQRLDQDDPTAHLLETREDIRHICLPGEIRTPEYRKQLKPKEWEKYYVDDLLDPVRLNWDILTKHVLKELGDWGYAGQVGQDPTPPGGGMFKVDHLQMVNAYDIRPSSIVKTVRYWDKAATEGGGAFTAGVKISELKNGKYVVWDVKRGQWATEERESIIRQTAEADGRDTEVGLEQEPGSGGKDSALSTVRNLAGFSVFTEHPTGDKPTRARPFAVQVNFGNVLMVYGDWNDAYKNELRYFPRSKFKDQVDGSSGSFNRLTAPTTVRIGRSNRNR
jgi:predicted phage terminase large subunit-like protein